MQYDDEQDVQLESGAPSSPGALLRDARKNFGLSIESVADELRLTPLLIMDLENDTPDPNIKKTYIRGYLRAYARLVNISPTIIIDRLEAQEAELNPRSEQKRLFRPKLPSDSPRETSPIWENASEFFEEIKTMFRSLNPDTTRSLTIVGLGIMIIAIWPEKSPQAIATAQMPESTIAELATPPQQTRSAAAQIALDAQTKRNLATLEVSFKDTCWITVFDGNHDRLATGLRDPKSPLTLKGVPPLRILLGNPKGAQLTYNGQDVDLDIPVNDEMVNLTLG